MKLKNFHLSSFDIFYTVELSSKMKLNVGFRERDTIIKAFITTRLQNYMNETKSGYLPYHPYEKFPTIPYDFSNI